MSSLTSVPRAVGPRWGIAFVLVAAAISGVSNFVNFGAVQGTDVAAWITVRNLAVAGMLVPFALLLGRHGPTRLTRTDWLRLLGIGLVGGAVPFLLYFQGFQMAARSGGAASASLGYRTLFLMAMALGVVVLREKLPRRLGLAAAALLAGSVLLVGMTGLIWTDGTGLVLVATALWAVEYTISKRALADLPAGTVALGRMGFGAAFLLTYLIGTGQAPLISAFGPSDWASAGLSALLLFAFVSTWYAGLKTTDLSVASALLVLGLPITWVLGAALHSAPLTAAGIGGAVAVLLGAAAFVGGAWSRTSANALASAVEVMEAKANR